MNVEKYFEYTETPWGKLFYKLALHNLRFENKDILDFGSGFGITARALAKSNNVTAIEPNVELLSFRTKINTYTQLCGSTEILATIPDSCMDVIICHNVFEYLTILERVEVLNEFYRVLRPNGILSVIKHNRYGKIMQKAVFEYEVEQAMSLLNGENSVSANFGDINEYSTDELMDYCNGKFELKNTYGIRTFYGLQNNQVKNDNTWLENMYKLECRAELVKTLCNIAFFHHIILNKI